MSDRRSNMLEVRTPTIRSCDGVVHWARSQARTFRVSVRRTRSTMLLDSDAGGGQAGERSKTGSDTAGGSIRRRRRRATSRSTNKIPAGSWRRRTMTPVGGPNPRRNMGEAHDYVLHGAPAMEFESSSRMAVEHRGSSASPAVTPASLHDSRWCAACDLDATASPTERRHVGSAADEGHQ